MKVYAKYKTEIVLDHFGLNPQIQFKIKTRVENKKYRMFKNVFSRHLEIDNWEEIKNLLEGDGIVEIVKIFIQEYFKDTQKEQSQKILMNDVWKLMNSTWKEIEVIIE